VLDDPAFAIATGTFAKSPPAIASDGSGWLVAWSEGGRVFAKRVDADGNVLDATGIALPNCCFYGGGVSPRVDYDGTDYLVAYTELGSGAGWMYQPVIAARVGTDGMLIDQTPIHVTAEDEYALEGLAWDGSHHLIATTHSDVWGGTGITTMLYRVDGNGTWLGLAAQLPGSDYGGGAVSSNGSQFLVAYMEDDAQGAPHLRAARIGDDGTLLDTPDGVAVGVTNATQAAPSLTFDGTRYLGAFTDNRWLGVGAARIDTDATVRDPGGFVVDPGPATKTPAASSDGAGRTLVAYEHTRSGLTLADFRLVDDVDQSLALGVACVADADCQSGACADGMCCDSACDQPCEACNQVPGTCLPVTQPVLGKRPRCAGVGTTCGGTCDGVDTGCQFPGAERVCRAPTCSGGYEYPADSCDGAGGCPLTYVSCYPYPCSGTACATSCDDDTGCDTGNVCIDHACVPPPPPVDAGIPDAAVVPDAASPDAAIVPDAAPPDAAILPDAAVPDAHAPDAHAVAAPDAGSVTTPSDAGCCRTDRGGADTFVIGLVLVGLVRRRNRATMRPR